MIHSYQYWSKKSLRERWELVLLHANDQQFTYETGSGKDKEVRQDYPYLLKVDKSKA